MYEPNDIPPPEVLATLLDPEEIEPSDGEPVQEQPPRYHAGCEMCQRIKDAGGFGPNHYAYEHCESGRKDHCTCDLCF